MYSYLILYILNWVPTANIIILKPTYFIINYNIISQEKRLNDYYLFFFLLMSENIYRFSFVLDIFVYHLTIVKRKNIFKFLTKFKIYISIGEGWALTN